MPGEVNEPDKTEKMAADGPDTAGAGGYYRVLGVGGQQARTDVLPADKNDAPHHGKGERHHEHGVEPPKGSHDGDEQFIAPVVVCAHGAKPGLSGDNGNHDHAPDDGAPDTVLSFALGA